MLSLKRLVKQRMQTGDLGRTGRCPGADCVCFPELPPWPIERGFIFTRFRLWFLYLGFDQVRDPEGIVAELVSSQQKQFLSGVFQ